VWVVRNEFEHLAPEDKAIFGDAMDVSVSRQGIKCSKK
jgi:hypothetical protein